MTQKEDCLGIIVARGGSKGLPRKNILNCAGKPLIAWTIEAAKSSQNLNRVIVSTDDDEIAHVAKAYGAEVPFLRPAELASDTASISDVIRHAIDTLKKLEGTSFKTFALLQATSPCRRAFHIDEAIIKFKNTPEGPKKTLVSVTRAPKKSAWLLKANPNDTIQFCLETRLFQRQALPTLFYPNGAIYIADLETFSGELYSENTFYYEMDANDSIDVDVEEDLIKAHEFLLKYQI